MESQTETAVTNEESDAEAAPGSPYAILFELEGVATAGRRAAFDVLKGLLGEHGKKFEPALFSRYGLRPSPRQYVPRLLEVLGVKLSAAKLAEDVKSGVVMNLSKPSAVKKEMLALLEAAKAEDISLCALSTLGTDEAESVMKKLGLDKLGVQLFAEEIDGDGLYPRVDTWCKMAKMLDKNPRCCVALVSTKEATKTAVAADMKCVVVPDEFTLFQDFGGAASVLDHLGETNPADFLADFCPPDK